jgi:hypothetical protein
MRSVKVIRNSDEHISLVNHRIRRFNGLFGWITWEEVHETFTSDKGNKIEMSLLVWTQF